jgi:hypothetical protein
MSSSHDPIMAPSIIESPSLYACSAPPPPPPPPPGSPPFAESVTFLHEAAAAAAAAAVGGAAMKMLKRTCGLESALQRSAERGRDP